MMAVDDTIHTGSLVPTNYKLEQNDVKLLATFSDPTKKKQHATRPR